LLKRKEYTIQTGYGVYIKRKTLYHVNWSYI